MNKYFRFDFADRKYPYVMIGSYVVLCVICVAAFFFSIFGMVKKLLWTQVDQMNRVQLENTVGVIDNELEHYRISLQTFFQEPNIRAALYQKEKDVENEIYISRYLNFVMTNDGCIDYCVIYKDGELKQIVGNYYPVKEEQEELLEMLQETKNDQEIFFAKSEEGRIERFFLFRMERDRLNAPPSRGIVYAINTRKFSKKMFSSANEENGYVVFDSSGNLILSQGQLEEIFVDHLREQIYIEDKNIKNNDKSDYHVIYKTNENQEMVVAQFTNSSEFDLLIDGIRSKTTWTSIIIILFCSVLASVMAYMICNPIRKFFSRLSSYTNEEYIQPNVDSKMIQNTSEKIISQISMMSKQIHSDKVLRYLEDSSETAIVPERLKLSEKNQQVIMLLIKCKIGNLSGKQIRCIHEKLQIVFKNIEIEVYGEEQGKYGLLIFYENRDNKGLVDRKIFLEQLKESLKELQEKNNTIFILCSLLHKDEKELPPAFEKLQEYAKYVLFDECSFLTDCNEYANKRDEEIPKKEFQLLLDIVKSGDDVRAKQEMVSVLKKLREYEIRRIFSALSYFSTELENLSTGTLKTTKKYQDAYLAHYIKLTSLNNQKQLFDYLSNVIEDACLEITTLQERSLRTSMLESIEYINQHYQEPEISVEQIAGIYHISISYYSRLFNSICEMSFPEYVNNLRMEYAGNLLRSTNLNVKEICVRAGFSNVSYFSTQFKKKYGVSPSTFRKNEIAQNK